MGVFEYLPVGSVVLLKGAKRNVVIIGYSVVEDGNDKVWDYLGSPYPMGVVGREANLMFDMDQIEKVLFYGYRDDEGKHFLELLVQEMEKVKNND